MFDLPEVLEVAAVVEDEEALFTCVFLSFYKIGTGQSRAKTCSASDHLPEFCFGPDFLEEHQVYTCGHVDAGVHHVHRNHDIRSFFGFLEIVDDGLGIAVVADDAACPCAVILRIKFVEAFQNELGVPFVLGKDDGLADAFAAVHPDAALHPRR